MFHIFAFFAMNCTWIHPKKTGFSALTALNGAMRNVQIILALANFYVACVTKTIIDFFSPVLIC